MENPTIDKAVESVEISEEWKEFIDCMYDTYSAYNTLRRIDVMQKFTGTPNEPAKDPEARLQYLERLYVYQKIQKKG